MDDIGCVLVYLPSYSPELNPAEFVFNKLKTCLKRIEYRELLRDNLHVGVHEGLEQITAADLNGFYKYAGYIHFIICIVETVCCEAMKLNFLADINMYSLQVDAHGLKQHIALLCLLSDS